MKELLTSVLIMSHTNACLHMEKVIPLPVAVESHALAQEWGGDLWLLINQPGNQQTQLLKISSSHEVEIIAALPIMAASMTSCDQQLIVTGSNAQGQSLIIGLDANGQLRWEYRFSGPQPTTWPIAACGPMPVIVWQQTPDRIETGLLDSKSGSLHRKPAIDVGTPPARMYSWKNRVWGAWAEQEGIHVVDLVEGGQRVVLTDGVYATEFSVGQSSEGAYFGWTTRNQACWLLPNTPSPNSVVIENLAGGTISLISGGMPLMWIQKSKQSIDEGLEWESTLTLADRRPHTVDGYVFTVAWWRQQVVVVNQSKVLVFRNNLES